MYANCPNCDQCHDVTGSEDQDKFQCNCGRILIVIYHGSTPYLYVMGR